MTAPASGPGADSATPLDPHGARQVRSARGALQVANASGLLAASDVHITERLVRLSGATVGEATALAVALAVRSVRLGSTCLALDGVDELLVGTDDAAGGTEAGDRAEPAVRLPGRDAMLADLMSGPLVTGASGGALDPLVLMDSTDGPLLYLRKYFRQEQTIRDILADRAARRPDVDVDEVVRVVAEVFGDDPHGDRQRVAAMLAATRWTTVLAGGPGTGKTYTVARVLAVLNRLAGGGLRIGMCAPTGRAAAQLQASVDADAAVPSTVQAVTLHRLLGWRPGSTPRHGRGNRLPHDVVVVDETSMLSITAMSRLLDAMRPDARLILVGDPHQLASVEAGAVLADLVDRDLETDAPPEDSAAATLPPTISGAVEFTPDELARLADGVVTLRYGFRFGSQIGRVADAINAGDGERALGLVLSDELPDVEMVAPDDLGAVRDDLVTWGESMRARAVAGDVDGALDALDSHRVLCAHRDGSSGVQGWTARVVDWLTAQPGYPRIVLDPPVAGGLGGIVEWVAGLPILVTANDRQTATFNGDCGVVVRTGAEGDTADAGPLATRWSSRAEGQGQDRSHHPAAVAFRRGATPREVAPTRLADVAPVYAMTIHRSQGSQFDSVTVVLPPAGSELLTRELLYTAITRARSRVRIVGTPDTFLAAVGRRVHRASGLRSAIRPFE
ncbi:exodeoxyribonuclease V subunit alpha [Gordonia sinesedis]